MLDASSNICLGVFGEKNTRLPSFDNLPRPLVESFLEASNQVAFEKSTISLAYIMWVSAGPLMLAFMPLIFLEKSSWSKILDRTSCPRMKR